MLRTALKEIIGLFVDDELLAVGILVVVAATAVAAKLMGLASLAAAVLLGGCLAVLVLGVMRTARARR